MKIGVRIFNSDLHQEQVQERIVSYFETVLGKGVKTIEEYAADFSQDLKTARKERLSYLGGNNLIEGVEYFYSDKLIGNLQRVVFNPTEIKTFVVTLK